MSDTAILRKKTYKDDGIKIEERVYYVLTDGPKSQPDPTRTAKLLALVVAQLVRSGQLTEAELDATLLELVA